MVKDKKLQLYRVIPKYIDALRDEANGGDLRVYKVSEGKEHRPFVGIITEFNGQNNFVIFSSCCIRGVNCKPFQAL